MKRLAIGLVLGVLRVSALTMSPARGRRLPAGRTGAERRGSGVPRRSRDVRGSVSGTRGQGTQSKGNPSAPPRRPVGSSPPISCSSNVSGAHCSGTDQKLLARCARVVTCNGVTTQCPNACTSCPTFAQQCADACGSCQPIVQCDPPSVPASASTALAPS